MKKYSIPVAVVVGLLVMAIFFVLFERTGGMHGRVHWLAALIQETMGTSVLAVVIGISSGLITWLLMESK